MNPKVYPTLASDAGVAALVSDRVYPVIAPQEVEQPYVVFTPNGLSAEQYFNSADDVDYDRVAIDCWAHDFPAAQMLARAVRDAFSGNGYIASAFDDYDPDTKLYRCSIDWSFVTLS